MATSRRIAWGIGLAAMLGVLVWGAGRAVGTTHRAASSREGSEAHAPGVDGAGISARTNDSAARRVRAQIVDDDGEPLEGGHVSLRCLYDDEVTAIDGNAWTLDEAGSFEGPGCFGVVCVELHHVTAVPADPWVLTPGEPAVLRATTLPRLYGTVVDARGRPVAAARVAIRPPADADLELFVPTIGTNTTTDVDGVFSFALVRRAPCDPCTEATVGCESAPLTLHEQVVVAVDAPRSAPARVVVDVDVDGDVEVPAVRLVPPADVLSGTLVDPQGNPYPRATIIARASNDPTDQHEASPDGESFAFESLGAGPYDLRAFQDGVELATARGVAPGDDVELQGDPIARGPDIALEVTEAGLPVAGVTVDGGPFRGARTDLHGRIEADLAMPGDYVLSLRPAGAATVRRAITIPAAASGATGPTAGPTATAVESDTPSPRVQLQVELQASVRRADP